MFPVWPVALAVVALKPSASDPALVERTLAEAGVDVTGPTPGWSGYVQVLIEAVQSLFREAGAPVGAVFIAYGWLAWAVSCALIVLVAGWVVWVTLRVIRAGAAARPRSVTGVTVESSPDPAHHRDAQAWRAVLERCLDAREGAPALEALWWWFACAVSGRDDLERSWTSREVVSRAGRDDLAAPAREIDRLLYGPRRPALDELRQLMGRLDRVLS